MLEGLEGRVCLTSPLSLNLSPLTGTVGIAYDAQVVVTGGSPGDTYIYKLAQPPGAASTDGLPDGVDLDGSGNLTGIPTQAGAFPIEIEVTDKTTGATGQEAFPLSIAPAITLSGSLPSGTEGSAYPDNTITASGLASPSCSFSSSDTLPSGLSLVTTGSDTAELTGTPNQAGTYSFTVTATGGGTSGVQPFEVTIAPDVSFTLETSPPAPALVGSYETFNQAPTPFENNLPVATEGQSYDQTIQASSTNPKTSVIY